MRAATLLVIIGILTSPAALAGEGRVAVVALPQGEWMQVYISYPASVTAEQVRQDLANLCAAGSLQLGQWNVTSGDDSTILTCYLRPRPESGKRSISIWPFVDALRRFDEIAVAYLGTARPGHGRVDNEFVELTWSSSATGISYLVRIKRRDFAGISELTANLGRSAAAAGHVGKSGSGAAAFVVVLLLAIAAGSVTYWASRKVLAAHSARA